MNWPKPPQTSHWWTPFLGEDFFDDPELVAVCFVSKKERTERVWGKGQHKDGGGISVFQRFDKAALPLLAYLPRVSEIDLAGCEISDDDLVYLESLTELCELNLTGTNITDAGLRRLHGLKSLRMVYLRGTKTTVAGFAEFRRHKPGCFCDVPHDWWAPASD